MPFKHQMLNVRIEALLEKVEWDAVGKRIVRSDLPERRINAKELMCRCRDL